ncbi:MAG: hypothetical protein QOC80_3052, partial [Frankiaceae bacterium]|nr:hypothetical protein [Frankiaceae bacterium]
MSDELMSETSPMSETDSGPIDAVAASAPT